MRTDGGRKAEVEKVELAGKGESLNKKVCKNFVLGVRQEKVYDDK